jgi:hypothetical protein
MAKHIQLWPIVAKYVDKDQIRLRMDNYSPYLGPYSGKSYLTIYWPVPQIII